MRYKIWNPVDHWNHKFVNGKDDRDSVWSIETLDIAETGDSSSGFLPVFSDRQIPKPQN